MLVPYKQEYEKIAMGLLSFMPTEKNIKKLQETVDHYLDNPNFHLYLWKGKAFIGVIGVEESEEGVLLRNLCVDPSHRNEGVATTMIQAVEKQLGVSLHGTKHTNEFLIHCREEGEV
ncbi:MULTISPECIES: GNAT family N-acetyltransferase [Bacillaceae]|uniref:GNAT family N-acetyltransferase n=1 Tax=Evansella alkalicola TaxID=745819 RepID=A0ABS6JZJ9_9BACI|nr:MULTISPECIES: GNAT family N-acetyltransferase [Bacillaceae]MBU9724018.1 GNAT family N-acetyltransferase [Bacillus alkalicola]